MKPARVTEKHRDLGKERYPLHKMSNDYVQPEEAYAQGLADAEAAIASPADTTTTILGVRESERGMVTSNEKPTNLADGLAEEIRRVREDVMPCYEEIGPPGAFALAMMRVDVQTGLTALASGDALEMLKALVVLKDCST